MNNAKQSRIDSENCSSLSIVNYPLCITSNDFARFFEAQARCAWMQLRRIAVAEVAEEIRFHRCPGEERRVNQRVIESGHRSAIQTESAGGENEIRPLQRRVPERGVLEHGFRQ